MGRQFAVLLTTLAALGAAHAPPAGAVTLSGDYYEDTAESNCPSTTACEVLFAVLPSSLDGKFLNLTEVSCVLTKTTGLIVGQIAVTDNGLNIRRRHNLQVERAQGTVSFLNNVDFKISGGPPRQVSIRIRTDDTSTIAMSCTIVGRISNV